MSKNELQKLKKQLEEKRKKQEEKRIIEKKWKEEIDKEMNILQENEEKEKENTEIIQEIQVKPPSEPKVKKEKNPEKKQNEKEEKTENEEKEQSPNSQQPQMSLDDCKTMLYNAIKDFDAETIKNCIQNHPEVIKEKITSSFKPIGYTIKFGKDKSLETILEQLEQLNLITDLDYFELLFIGYPYSKKQKSTSIITPILLKYIKKAIQTGGEEIKQKVSTSEDKDLQELQ